MNIKFSLIVFIILIIIIMPFVYKFIRWKMYIWFPDYIINMIKYRKKYDGDVHILFLTVDHYEPGYGESGALINKEWIDSYRLLADKHKDSNGRPPQHTWFYAYDHKNDLVMKDLSQFTREGYGEIEFHWHHKHDTNQSFPGKLKEGLCWFNKYGAMVDVEGTKSFAFIHGNWSLDNSRGNEFCGVSRELQILKSFGCYADFTFPAFGQISQPRLANKIYYAVDDDNNKSYDAGIESYVGFKNVDHFMIFQGPISPFTYGAIELDPYPDNKDIDRWINANIHVSGRPEWVFVKTFTHGVQSRKIFFSNVTEKMFFYLESKYNNGKYKLHYVTAREAYNVVRAAEDGKFGNPREYFNYEIKPPVSAKRM